MVILFLVIGTFFGAIAASVALLTGGTVILALMCYSIFGTLSALLVAYAVFLQNEANDNSPDWADNQDGNGPVSA